MHNIVGYIGLGKMGLNMTKRLVKKGWRIVAYDPSPKASLLAVKNGVDTKLSIAEVAEDTPRPRIFFVMVPHKTVVAVIKELSKLLEPGDIVIDGGNSHFEESIKHFELLKSKKIEFLDAGISGGPMGALKGACVMVGGEAGIFKKTEELFKDIAQAKGYAYVGKSGAGHFAKMIHNGIEYGMMQSLSEGFAILKRSPFKYDLEKLADLYSTGSVIESRLTGWLAEAYKIYGKDLKKVSGIVAHTGEGDWTVEIARKLKVGAPAIEQALIYRKNSAKKKDYTGKILSALRNRFGGHSINNK